MGKRKMFETFVTQNLDNLYRFAYTYMRNQQDAEDVVSESVVKALQMLPQLNNPKQMKTWFYRILINTSFTNLKRKKRTVSMEEADLAKEELVFDDYSRITLEEMIQKLDLKYREVIVLRFLEDLKINEIANLLKTNESTIKTRLYRGLELLKADLGGEGQWQ